jgi:hypothetical protein
MEGQGDFRVLSAKKADKVFFSSCFYLQGIVIHG